MNGTWAVLVTERMIADGIPGPSLDDITVEQLGALGSLPLDHIAPSYVCADLDLEVGSTWGDVKATIDERRGVEVLHHSN
jgi:hypothetical protein